MSLKGLDKVVMNVVLYPILHPITAIGNTIEFAAGFVMLLIAGFFKTIEVIWDIFGGICLCIWWCITELWGVAIIALIFYGLYNLIW